jgi:hypothetical protein
MEEKKTLEIVELVQKITKLDRRKRIYIKGFLDGVNIKDEENEEIEGGLEL